MSRPRAILPVTYSTVSTTALMQELAADYDIAQPTKCVFLNRGLNDTYLVMTTDARYVLRIYRHQWRSLEDVLYEIDLLTHLQRRGAPISGPIARRDGRFVGSLCAPEGDRHTVLFTYAPGAAPSWPPEELIAGLYGQAAAEIHTGLDDFSSTHARFRLDLDFLIDAPLTSTLPFLKDRPDDADYLRNLAGRLKEWVTLHGDALEQGACHGDFHGGNCHVAGDQLTLFDFDCCAPGWRVFDLATFRWGLKVGGMDEKSWTAFLTSYTSRRSVNEVNLEAVPLFVAIRHIWLLGLHTSNAHDWGSVWMDTTYFDRALKFLHEWEAEHLTRM